MAENTFADPSYFFEKREVEDDSSDEFDYEEVVLDDEEAFEPDLGDEDLETVIRVLGERALDEQLSKENGGEFKQMIVASKPEQVDDFVRNFLMRMKMKRTLDCFQNEWFEKQERSELSIVDIIPTPDVYSHNQCLRQELAQAVSERDNFKNAAIRARELCMKIKKERNFHKLEHRRLTNEKNKLIADIQRMKKHYGEYEPALQEMQNKYENAMRQKMLTKIDRDRAHGQIAGLKSTLQHYETLQKVNKAGHNSNNNCSTLVPLHEQAKTKFHECRSVVASKGDTISSTLETSSKRRDKVDNKDTQDVALRSSSFIHNPSDSKWPVDNGVNPKLAQLRNMQINLRATGMRMASSLELHEGQAIAGIALHPTKPVGASASDDGTWRLWTVPTGELLMTGRGHTDWVSDVQFHPDGSHLATTSGDHTARLWDFSTSRCSSVFDEHQGAVWSLGFHSNGDFMATCSADASIKLWDLRSERCRATLRGHTASVSSVNFLPYSNIVVSSSVDKTVSLWQGETGVCAHTFFGHMHPVLGATFNPQGTLIASCDSFGQVKLWDIRGQKIVRTITTVPHAANSVKFDPTGALLAIASDDGTIKLIEVTSGKTGSLTGHRDSVQSIDFDPAAQFVVSSSSDGTVKFWN